MDKILSKLEKIGIVPVVVLNDAEDAVPLVKALCEGGLMCAEVTFRTTAAEESIRRISAEFPQMLVGAGTVLTTEQVDRAEVAGAKFIVSPGFNPRIVRYCLEKGIAVMPGVSGPGEIEQALELGLEAVKFFPAEAMGGLAAIKAMAAPYGNVRFMPTGGIHAGNICDYLAFPKVLACGGSWMVKSDMIRAGEFKQITKLTREAVTTMLGFELLHIGINCEDEKEADWTAGVFESIFGFVKKAGNSSIFAGTEIEAMKKPYLGEKGHIAIGTNSVERAVFYLEAQGVEFDFSTAKYKGERLTAMYLKKEIAGFAVQLVQK